MDDENTVYLCNTCLRYWVIFQDKEGIKWGIVAKDSIPQMLVSSIIRTKLCPTDEYRTCEVTAPSQVEYISQEEFEHTPGYDAYFSNGETLEVKDGQVKIRKGIDH